MPLLRSPWYFLDMAMQNPFRWIPSDVAKVLETSSVGFSRLPVSGSFIQRSFL